MYQRILVATDGSTLSKKAVASAIDLAATCGAELIAIKVVPRYPQAYFEGSIPLSSEEIARVEAQWTETARVQLATVEKNAKAKAVNTKAITVKSDVVSDAIIAAAKKHKADLIVMATGYKMQQETVRQFMGDAIADKIGPVWGFNDGGELRNMWCRTPQPGLWFTAGSLAQCRIFSRYLALQIKALEEGLID